MATALVLALLNISMEFTIEVNASNIRIGDVLSQGGKLVAYFNKALSHTHQFLLVYEKEMLAILTAIKNRVFTLLVDTLR